MLNPDGSILLSLLPGEKRKIPKTAAPLMLITLQRNTVFTGLCGAGPVQTGRSCYGLWGRFECHLRSADRFVFMNGQAFAQGRNPVDIISQLFRPLLKDLLDHYNPHADQPADLQEKLITTLSAVSLQHGLALDHFRLQRIGPVQGGNI